MLEGSEIIDQGSKNDIYLPARSSLADDPGDERILLVTECLGAFLFVCLGGMVIAVTGDVEAEEMSCVRAVVIALTDGFLYYAIIYVTMKMSRGKGVYFNPALAVALTVQNLYLNVKPTIVVDLVRLLKTTLVQFFGSCVGAAMVYMVVPRALDGLEKTGVASPNFGETDGEAFLLEIFLTFILTIVILNVRRNEERKSSIVIGFCFVSLRLFSLPLTGSTMNPARAFGHSVVGGAFDDYWIFFFGPCIGAVLGAVTWLSISSKF